MPVRLSPQEDPEHKATLCNYALLQQARAKPDSLATAEAGAACFEDTSDAGANRSNLSRALTHLRLSGARRRARVAAGEHSAPRPSMRLHAAGRTVGCGCARVQPAVVSLIDPPVPPSLSHPTPFPTVPKPDTPRPSPPYRPDAPRRAFPLPFSFAGVGLPVRAPPTCCGPAPQSRSRARACAPRAGPRRSALHPRTRLALAHAIRRGVSD